VSAAPPAALPARAPWYWAVGGMRRALGWAAFILGPLLTLLLWAFAGSWLFPNLLPEFSLRWWAYVPGNADVGKAIRMSFLSAPVATLLSAVLCIPAAYAFARLEFPAGGCCCSRSSPQTPSRRSGCTSALPRCSTA
jgi:ABC-type spermidine/putrescine transport system permease subunit II